MSLNFQERIRRDSRIAGCDALIRGSRVTLRTVLTSLAEGATIEQILGDCPTLTADDVRAAIERFRVGEQARTLSTPRRPIYPELWLATRELPAEVWQSDSGLDGERRDLQTCV